MATAMLTAHPDMKGIFVARDTPAQQVVAAAKTLGRKIVVTTNDIAQDSALNVARGEFLAVGAQRPYDQGVTEAKAAAIGLLGKEVPLYIEVPTLREKLIFSVLWNLVTRAKRQLRSKTMQWRVLLIIPRGFRLLNDGRSIGRPSSVRWI